MIKRWNIRLLSVFILLICVAFPVQAAGAKPGGVLKIGLSAEPPDLNPFIQSGGASERVKSMVYDSLLAYNEKGEIVGAVAESWQIPNSKTFIFKIHDSAKFHNGEPVTSDDVKFSLEIVLNPKSGAFLHNQLVKIVDRITPINQKTIKIELKKADATFLGLLGMVHTAVVSKKWMAAGNKLESDMMGAGPFKFVKWDSGVKIKLAKNENFYKKGLPYLQGVDLVPIKDEDVRVNSLIAGEVDFIDFPPWKSWKAIEARKNLTITKTANFAMVLFFNPSHTPFSDPRVRRAVTMAIDDKIIGDVVFFGNAVPANGGLLPPGHWATSSEIQNTLPYNPEKAKALLAEAGYKNGFKAKLLATSTYGMHRMTAEVINDLLKAYGIEVELELEEWGTTIERRAKGDYQFMVYAAGLTRPDPDFYSGYIASGSGFMARPVDYKDPVIDELLQKGRETLSLDKRKKIYHELEKRFLEQSPIGVLARRQSGFALDKKVKGFKNFALGYSSCIGAFEGIWLDN